jgi:hypothetical protein
VFHVQYKGEQTEPEINDGKTAKAGQANFKSGDEG